MQYRFLGKINNPDDLKQLNNEEKYALCSEIRSEIIDTVSKNGGHLASNLGVVELTVAIHSTFNAPDDTIIFDVGHQCYTHKLLTGRFEQFSTLRREDGISGFMRPEESIFDPFVTGHSSNAVSAACGFAQANAMLNKKTYTVAVVGDGALTGGMAFEGLNNSADDHGLILILNDNKMSISRNVGALSRYLNNVRTRPSYYRMKRVVDRFVSRIPLIGPALRRGIYESKAMIKNAIYHNEFFEGMGFDYLGPVDGHNIEKLCRVMEIAKAAKRPVVIHALTVKGRGYKYAEAMPGSYHGVAPFNVETGVDAGVSGSFSAHFGESLCEIARNDDRVCAVTAAMTEGTGLLSFAAKFPSRFFDVGIAEQHAVTFCCGLAARGFKPFFAVYSSFLQRGFDQVVHDAAIAELPITLCIDRAGLTGNDGETHQGVFDVSLLSQIPNVRIFAPTTFAELKLLLRRAADRKKGIWAIRYPRGAEAPLPEEMQSITDEQPYCIYKNGCNNIVVSYGVTFGFAVQGLNQKVDYCKLNEVNSCFDDMIDKLLSYKRIFVFEENVQRGGIGEQLALKLLQKGYRGIYKAVAVPDEFVKQATQSRQREKYKLDKNGISETVLGGNDD